MTTLEKRIEAALRARAHEAGCSGIPIAELIGCSILEFIEYLGARFLPGMSFDNYGQGADDWSLDHINDISYFDCHDPEQARSVFHYSNTRPLWNTENWSRPKHTTVSAAAILSTTCIAGQLAWM